MAWGYKGRLDTSTEDRVRFLIGDTDPTGPLTEDVEVRFALSSASGVEPIAGAILADALAARYEQRAGVSLAGIGLDFGARAAGLRDMARFLRNAAAGGFGATGTPVAAAALTGINPAEYARVRHDTINRIPLMIEQDEGEVTDSDYAPYVGPLPYGGR